MIRAWFRLLTLAAWFAFLVAVVALASAVYIQLFLYGPGPG